MSFFNLSKKKASNLENKDFSENDDVTSSTLDKALARSRQKDSVDSSTVELQNTKEVNHSEKIESQYNLLAPYPMELSDTGLSDSLLLTLMLKHLHVSGVLTLRELASNLKVSGTIVQQLVEQAKNKSFIENYANNANDQMRFSLSSIGTMKAEKEFLKSGYIGAAPVPISQYTEICKKQTSRNHSVTLDELHEVFQNLTFSEELLGKVGPALNSTKPILIYGDAGTGKSFFCRHLNLVFGGDVLIPHAIEVNNEIIQIFDPEIHQVNRTNEQNNVLKLSTSFDPRWLLCTRPLVVSGGELSADMLEVKFDPSTKTYRAPLQLKANNGILLLDDLGRQKVTPKELFNRWIIPLEEQRDFLSLQSGLHFEIPFELLLLFSTNLTPTDLVDDAFLRRLGYKIEFEPLTKSLYQQVWFSECEDKNISCSDEMFTVLLDDYHHPFNKNLLPCYPRDLLCIASDQIKFKQLPQELTKELLDFAWHSYFVK